MATKDQLHSRQRRLRTQTQSLRTSRGTSRCSLSLPKSLKSQKVGVRTCSTRWRAKEKCVQNVLSREASVHTPIISSTKQLLTVTKKPPRSRRGQNWYHVSSERLACTWRAAGLSSNSRNWRVCKVGSTIKETRS